MTSTRGPKRSCPSESPSAVVCGSNAFPERSEEQGPVLESGGLGKGHVVLTLDRDHHAAHPRPETQRREQDREGQDRVFEHVEASSDSTRERAGV